MRRFPAMARDNQNDRAAASQNRMMARLGISDFETPADCRRRQIDMLHRFDQCTELGGALNCFAYCEADWCPCRVCADACYFAARNRRIKEISSGYGLLTKRGGPFADISLVHPRWQHEIGKLRIFSIPAARQWFYRRLKKLRDVIVIGSFEACVNTELDGTHHWALGLHAIAAGASKSELRNALSFSTDPRLPASAKPLLLGEVDNLGRQLGYALKHFVEERRAYINPNNDRIQRRHLPPSSELWAEHDAWLASLPSGARTIAIGCERRHGRFFPLHR